MSHLYILILFLFSCSLSLRAQDNSLPVRQPEQEAKIQTERLKQKIDLSEEQEALVYRINLRYAQERQISNSRAEAMQRIKRKDEDLRRVLSEEQYHRMRNEKYDNIPSQALSAEPVAPNPSAERGEVTAVEAERSEYVPIQSFRNVQPITDKSAEQDLAAPLKEYSTELLDDGSFLHKEDSAVRKIDTRTRTTPTDKRRMRLTNPTRSKVDERTRRRSLQKPPSSSTKPIEIFIERDSIKTKTGDDSSARRTPLEH